MLSKKGRYKIFFLLFIAVCTIWVGVPGTTSATDYYVDANNGDDDQNDGTALTPWKTLHRAVTGLTEDGDVIHLLTGVYDSTIEDNSSLIINYNGITIQGESPGEVIIDGTSLESWYDCITIYGYSNLTVTGLTIHAFTMGGAIVISESADSKVQNCIIYNNSYGISVSNCSAEISSNILYDNTVGMYLDNSDTAAYSPSAINNLIYKGSVNPTNVAISVNANNAIGGCILTPIIYHNTLVGGTQDGIYLNNIASDTFEPEIKYNIITDFGQYAVNNYNGLASAVIDYNNTNNNTSGNFSTGLTQGSNDIHADPLYSNATINDYHMTINSPCVDVIPSAVNTVLVDLDGYTRPQGDDKDMGCYEFLPEPADATNQPPDKPTAVSPADLAIISTSSVILRTSAFSDPDDGDTHESTTWKVWRDDQDEMNTVYYNETSNSAGLTAQTITDLQTGMRYVWKAGYMDSAGELSWSAEYRFTVGTVTTQYGDIPAGSEIADYRMYSIPKWMDTALCKALFGHLPVEKYNTGLVRVGTYDPKTGGYIECGPDLKPHPGQAFWLLIRKGITLPITGIPVSRNVSIERKLAYNTTTQNGWNMIACPNTKRYKWQDIIVVVKDTQGSTAFGPFLVSELEDNTYIDRRIWDWDEGSYTSYNNSSDFTLRPAYGYWVKVNMENVSLIFEEGELVSDATDLQRTFSHSLRKLIADAKAWLKKALDYPKSAIADDADITPPMPMGIDETETPDDKCFIMNIGF